MPYTNNWEEKGLYRKFTGTISGIEILEANLKLHLDPRFNNIEYVLNDFTEVSDLRVETKHTSAYAASDKVISDRMIGLKIALVVVTELQINLANAYRDQMKDSNFKCEVFTSLDDAYKWVRP